MYDWNDLKAFLAVAETGSTLSAAQALRVSQTTVARRIAALEAATSLNLFERRQAGYALTPVGEAMLASAIAVRDAANKKMMSDPRMVALMEKAPVDGRRMIFGGFEAVFES